MGFKIEQSDGNMAFIQATNSGDHVPELLQCLKDCMAQRVVNIELGFIPETPDTPDLIEVLLKTDQFLKSKNGSLVLKDIPSNWTEENLSKLNVQKTNANKVEEQKSSENKEVKSSIDLLPQIQKIYGAFEDDKTLPEKLDLEKSIPWMLDQIKILYTQEEYLKSEAQFFEEHLKSLKKGYKPDPKMEAQAASIMEAEKKLHLEQQKVAQLREALSQATNNFQQKSQELQNTLKSLETDSRKKKDVLEKQLKDLKTALQKLEQDFQKKSESRQKEIQKFNTEKASGDKKQ